MQKCSLILAHTDYIFMTTLQVGSLSKLCHGGEEA